LKLPKALEIYILAKIRPIDTALEARFKTKLFPNAYVYHKRRIEWDKFSVQVNKFGVRPVLNSWYPEYNKLSFFFRLFYHWVCCGRIIDCFNFDLLLQLYFIYFLILFWFPAIKIRV
jgi:hypothetical protein